MSSKTKFTIRVDNDFLDDLRELMKEVNESRKKKLTLTWFFTEGAKDKYKEIFLEWLDKKSFGAEIKKELSKEPA